MHTHLRVTAEALRALAGRCETLAGGLASSTPSASAVISDRASLLAVGTCDERIAAAGAALAARAEKTAASITAAARAYELTDTGSATDLDTSVI